MTAAAAPPLSRRTLLGVTLDAVTLDAALDRIDAAIRGRSPLLVGVVNAAKVVNMRHDEALRADVLGSDLVLADGMSLVWAGKLLRRRLPERVAGIDLMHGILARGNAHGYRVFCLGATAAVLDAAIARIGADHPGVAVVGAQHGYFTADEERDVVDAIRRARPDVLFVAMTSPKKERFLARWRAELDVPVCHGVGGSFDVLAGAVQRAPERWQRFGFEWLYRLKQEPRRLWKRYLKTNTVFCAMVVGELCRDMRPGRAARARRSGTC